MTEDHLAPDAKEARIGSRILQLAWIAAYSFALLLLLRSGGRTYPGWYFPDSAFLNWLLNDVRLFTGLGYDLVLIGAAAGALRTWLGRRAPRPLRLLQWIPVALVIFLVAYGLAWAIMMERLPWQPDGYGRYTL